MNIDIQEIRKYVVGKELSPKQIVAICRDVYPKEKGDNYILSLVVTSGIISEIRKSNIDEMRLRTLVSRLVSDYFIQEEPAREAIEFWRVLYSKENDKAHEQNANIDIDKLLENNRYLHDTIEMLNKKYTACASELVNSRNEINRLCSLVVDLKNINDKLRKDYKENNDIQIKRLESDKMQLMKEVNALKQRIGGLSRESDNTIILQQEKDWCIECIKDERDIRDKIVAYAEDIIRDNNKLKSKQGIWSIFSNNKKEIIDIYSLLGIDKTISSLQCRENILLQDDKYENIILFGSFSQFSEKKDMIQWQVIKKDGKEIMAISKYGLMSMPYDNTFRNTTWNGSSLNAYLQKEFTQKAFNKHERIRLRSISLLSSEEFNTYMYANKKCIPTSYAINQGAQKNADDCCAWWLKSKESLSVFIPMVNFNGDIIYGHVNTQGLVVRPVIRISATNN